MFCKYCGNEIPTGSIFCEHCGKKLTSHTTKRQDFSNQQRQYGIQPQSHSKQQGSYQHGTNYGQFHSSKEGSYQWNQQNAYQQGNYSGAQNQTFHTAQRKSSNQKGVMVKGLFLVLALIVLFFGVKFMAGKVVEFGSRGFHDLLQAHKWFINPVDDAFLVFDFFTYEDAHMYSGTYTSYPGPLPGFTDDDWKFRGMEFLTYKVRGKTVSIAPEYAPEEKLDLEFEVNDGMIEKVTVRGINSEFDNMTFDVFCDPDTVGN